MSINGTLVAQAIVFALLVLFTMKFVWPPITKALDERAQKIADGLAAADKAKAELSNANARVEAELAQSRNETASRLADAERRAQGIVDEAKARATEEGNKIIAAFQPNDPTGPAAQRARRKPHQLRHPCLSTSSTAISPLSPNPC